MTHNLFHRRFGILERPNEGSIMLERLKKWKTDLNIIIGSLFGAFIGHPML